MGKKYVHPNRSLKSVEELEILWENYKISLEEESKKWGVIQYVGRDGERVEDYPKLPMTFEGFSVFCYHKVRNLRDYFDNGEGWFVEFVEVCTRIRAEIRNDQITGGLLGKYNPSITQRLNNLKEAVEQTVNIEPRVFNI